MNYKRTLKTLLFTALALLGVIPAFQAQTTNRQSSATVDARTQSKPVDFEQLGGAYLKDLGETTAPALPDLLARHFTRFAVGGFDLCVPTGMLAKGQDPARIPAIATAIVDLQVRLAELTTTDPGALKATSAPNCARKSRRGVANRSPSMRPRPRSDRSRASS